MPLIEKCKKESFLKKLKKGNKRTKETREEKKQAYLSHS